MRFLSVLFIFSLFIGCSNQTPKNMPDHIDQLIAEDQYQEAIELLANTDSTETDADLKKLKEKTHLNYGMYMEYRGPKESSMRDRMTTALRQYIEVLKINPENQKARSEIDQIMGIYSTMPDKGPGEDIRKELQQLGFDY